jgi:hypothetical protein
MDSAKSALIGIALGAFAGIAGTWIKSYFDDRKSRREVMLNIAYDFWQSVYQEARARGVQIDPFETFVFHTMKVLELAQHKNLTNEQIRAQLKKIRELSDGLNADFKEKKDALQSELPPRAS